MSTIFELLNVKRNSWLWKVAENIITAHTSMEPIGGSTQHKNSDNIQNISLSSWFWGVKIIRFKIFHKKVTAKILDTEHFQIMAVN
jgi:hypothetical protein